MSTTTTPAGPAPTAWLHPAERAALMDLYTSTRGDAWRSKSRWGVGEPCGISTGPWHGLACDEAAHIVEIHLTVNDLEGTLPLSLTNLTELQQLQVQRNRISGPLPPLHAFTHLKVVNAHDNNITGAVPSLAPGIPGGVPSALQTLDLRNNNLTSWDLATPAPGSAALGLPSSLSLVDVSVNDIEARLSAYVWAVMGNTPVTQLIAFGNKRLSIDLEAVFSTMTSLVLLDLSYTATSGDFTVISDPANTFVYSLRILWLRGCAGMVGELRNDFESLTISAMDIRGTSMRAAGLPSWLRPGLAQEEFGTHGSAACRPPEPRDLAGEVVIRLDSSYDNYARCGCVAGYFGRGVECKRCPGGTWSAANSSTCEACPAGTWQRHGSPQDSIATCVGCGEGSFSLPESQACFVCPSGIDCGTGSVHVDPGKWWLGGLVISQQLALYDCLSNAACPGPSDAASQAISDGTTNVTAVCGEGYRGPICAVCDEGWAAATAGVCSPCLAQATELAIAAVAGVTFCVFLLCTLHRNAKGRRKLAAERARGGDMGRRSALRVLVTFLQTVALVGDFRARSTELVHRVLGTASGIGGDSVAHAIGGPLFCAYNVGLFGRVVASALLPPAAMVIVAAWAASRSQLMRKRRWTAADSNASPRHDFIAGATAVLFLLYSRVTKIALSAFKTHPQPIHGEVYVQADFGITTSSSQYSALLAIGGAVLLVYSLAAPFAAFASLRAARLRALGAAKRGNRPAAPQGGADLGRDRLDALGVSLIRSGDVPSITASIGSGVTHVDGHSNGGGGSVGGRVVAGGSGDSTEDGGVPRRVVGDAVRERLAVHPMAMLTRGYRVWWWEATVVARKLTMACIAVFVNNGDMQIVLTTLLMVSLFAVQMWLRPFNTNVLNDAEAAALFAVFVTALSSVLFTHVDSFADGTTGAYIVSALLLAMNLAVTVWLVRLYLGEAPWRPLVGWCRRRARLEVADKGKRSVGRRQLGVSDVAGRNGSEIVLARRPSK